MDQPLLPADAALAALHWRYATKKFDPNKKLSAEEWAKFEQALVLAPSSYGLQPYKFLVVTDQALKEKLLPASYGQRQVVDCSHLVVFAARTDLTETDIDHYLERVSQVRGTDLEHLKNGFGKVIKGDVVHGPRHAMVKEWCARQAYIALGQLMTFASLVSVDICPMEGFENDKYDEILGLPAQGYRAVVMAPVGHRAEDDGAAGLPKVRFPVEELVERR